MKKRTYEKYYSEYEKLWKMHAPSGHTERMEKLLRQMLKERKLSYTRDTIGNFYVGDFDQTKPCIVAHIDNVHQKASRNFTLKNGVLSSENGIGGDDKCGIIAVFEALKHCDVNAILTVDEEIGGVGASAVPADMLKNVMYFIEVDRRGDSDIIYSSGGNLLCSDKMQEVINPVAIEFGFTPAHGTYTDINELTATSKKSGFNLSAGYFNAHTSAEYVCLASLSYSIEFVKFVFDNVRETFEWQEQKPYSWLDDWSPSRSDIYSILNKAVDAYGHGVEALIWEAFDAGSEAY